MPNTVVPRWLIELSTSMWIHPICESLHSVTFITTDVCLPVRSLHRRSIQRARLLVQALRPASSDVERRSQSRIIRVEQHGYG